MHEPEYCSAHGRGAYYCDECVGKALQRADSAEAKVAELTALIRHIAATVSLPPVLRAKAESLLPQEELIPKDVISELVEVLRDANAEPYLHEKGCATWQAKPCDRGCGSKSRAKRIAAQREQRDSGKQSGISLLEIGSCPLCNEGQVDSSPCKLCAGTGKVTIDFGPGPHPRLDCCNGIATLPGACFRGTKGCNVTHAEEPKKT